MNLKFMLVFISGIVIGGTLGAYLFVDTRSRTFLEVPPCKDACFSAKELGGLLVSLGMLKTPDLLPRVVKETDRVVAMKSPEPLATVDYLILPKKDILDLGDVSQEDAAYIAESFEVMADLIRSQNLKDYKVITNGPGFQQVRYLHFHLLAQ